MTGDGEVVVSKCFINGDNPIPSNHCDNIVSHDNLPSQVYDVLPQNTLSV
jgi:hypothetical protein